MVRCENSRGYKEIAEVEKLEKPKGALVASVGENNPATKQG